MRSTLEVDLVPAWSNQSTTTAMFIPITGAIPMVNVRTVRYSYLWGSISPLSTVRRAYNTSDDGITWSGTVTGIGSFSTSWAWVWDDSAGTNVTTDPRSFVRFGIEVKNVNDTRLLRGSVAAQLEMTPTGGGTVSGGRAPVWSDGTTSMAVFVPLTEYLPSAGVEEMRATVELDADSGDLRVRPGYQVSDAASEYNIVDSGSFGATQTGNGIAYGTSFSDFAPTTEAKLVRFGVWCGNATTASKCQGGLASIHVDYRLKA